MKRTLSLFLAGLILAAGTAYAPGKKPAKSAEQIFQEAHAAVAAIPENHWKNGKPQMDNRAEVMEAYGCLPANARGEDARKGSYHKRIDRCVQSI